MRPEVVWGVALGFAILVPVLVPVVLRTRAFARDADGERWGRYEYRITRNGSFVFESSSFRREVPEDLDYVAQLLLVEWFECEDGERALVLDSHRGDYQCIALLRGYGAGEAWGR
jgi:hypothetical protein